MTLFELFIYFENYASAHKELQHVPSDNKRTTAFIAANSEETSVEELIKNSERELLMVLLPYDKKMLPVNGESYNWGKSVTFLVIKKCSKSSGKEVFQAQSQCEQIADDFVTRFIDDRTNKIDSLDLTSLYMEPVGPIATNRYGYICMFNLVDGYDHWVNADRWQA